MAINPKAQTIIDTCKAKFAANSNNCSGFVKAVTEVFNVTLTGVADDITDEIQTGNWTKLPNGIEAKAKADAGWLVVGAMKGRVHVPPQTHGHVVIVVTGPLADGEYPTGYWGQLGGIGKENATLNYAWNRDSRDKIIYAAIEV